MKMPSFDRLSFDPKTFMANCAEAAMRLNRGDDPIEVARFAGMTLPADVLEEAAKAPEAEILRLLGRVFAHAAQVLTLTLYAALTRCGACTASETYCADCASAQAAIGVETAAGLFCAVVSAQANKPGSVMHAEIEARKAKAEGRVQ